MTEVAHGLAGSEHPHYATSMHQPETAKNIHVYLNGDKFYPGRKFVVNKKHVADFDGFLNQVTMGIKAPFGAVRNIYTPQGGRKVQELNQLQTGMQVVAGGVERFRKLEYKEIGSKRKQKPRRNFLEIRPNPHRMLVSARWRKYIKDPCQIYVYGNGDIIAPALKLLLIPRTMKSWDLVLGEITEKICIRTGQAVRKLYDMNYRLLRDPSELENGHYYVAVGSEKLKKYPYGELASKTPSPRKIIHHQPLPPIRRHKPKPPADEEGENTYSRMYAQKKQHKAHVEETTVMGASAATGYRPLRTKKFKPAKPSTSGSSPDGSAVFPPKPVKVKRMSGVSNATTLEPLPAAEASDGVYKTETQEIKAETVAEDEDTKLDLPIDQVKAVEVEEEVITSARSDDVIADKQAITARTAEDDDVATSRDSHIDDDRKSDAPLEDETTVKREEDNESITEDAVTVAATTALLVSDTEITVKDEEFLVVESPDKVQEEHPVAEDDVGEAEDPLKLGESPPPPVQEDVEPADQTEVNPVDSTLAEDEAERVPTSEVAPETEEPEKDASEETLPPEPEASVEVDDPDNEASEVWEAEASNEIPPSATTPEPTEEALEASGAVEDGDNAENRSITPSSPKPREEEDKQEDAEDAAEAPLVAADPPESPKDEPTDDAPKEEDAAKADDAPEEEETAQEESPPKEDAPDNEVTDEEKPEDRAASVHDEEKNEAPLAAPEDESAPPADQEESTHADPEDSAPAAGDNESEKAEDDEDKNSKQGKEDTRDSLDAPEEGAPARFVGTRPASGPVSGDEDNAAPETPSTKRSLANGDAVRTSGEVEP